MAMTAADYLQQAVALLPRGRAWPRALGQVRDRILAAAAESFARVDARARQLIEEADPRTTLELLPEWEAYTGLPDPCAGPAQTLEGRRRRVAARLTQLGGQSPAHMIQVAAGLGYTVGITEFSLMTCDSACDATLYTLPWRFAWRVDAPAATIEVMTCSSFCNEPLRSWGNAVLECVLTRIKPSQTVVLFAYGA